MGREEEVLADLPSRPIRGQLQEYRELCLGWWVEHVPAACAGSRRLELLLRREEADMTVTITSAEVFFLALPEEVELDTDQPRTRDDLVATFERKFTPVPEDKLVDLDVDDNVF